MKYGLIDPSNAIFFVFDKTFSRMLVAIGQYMHLKFF